MNDPFVTSSYIWTLYFPQIKIWISLAEIYLEIEKKVPLVVSEINLPEQSTWYIGQKAEYDIEKRKSVAPFMKL